MIECDAPGAKWRRVADPSEHGAFALISELNHQPLDLYGGGDPGRRNTDIQTCTSPPMKTNNLWRLSAAGSLSAAGTKGCVHTGNVTIGPDFPPTLGSQNVWARQMAGGNVALFFFNVGLVAKDIACDAACFAAAGLPTGKKYARLDRTQGPAGAAWVLMLRSTLPKLFQAMVARRRSC